MTRLASGWWIAPAFVACAVFWGALIWGMM